MVRITLGGDDLAHFTPMGHDQWFRLFLPRDPHSEPPLPTSAGAMWWPQVLRMPENSRPYVRNYTVSGFRATADGTRELDVDFVLHESPTASGAAGDGTSESSDGSASGGGYGVASEWAARAEPGMSVGLLDQGIGWNPPGPFEHALIVGDETALPAVAGIARDLPVDARGTIVVEVPHPDDRRELGQPAGVDVRWIVRDDHAAKPGQQALATAASVAESTGAASGALYAYVSGEQALATGLRRALVARGVPKSHITFCGYWRL